MQLSHSSTKCSVKMALCTSIWIGTSLTMRRQLICKLVALVPQTAGGFINAKAVTRRAGSSPLFHPVRREDQEEMLTKRGANNIMGSNAEETSKPLWQRPARAELVWDGKYDTNGRRCSAQRPRGLSLPMDPAAL